MYVSARRSFIFFSLNQTSAAIEYLNCFRVGYVQVINYRHFQYVLPVGSNMAEGFENIPSRPQTQTQCMVVHGKCSSYLAHSFSIFLYITAWLIEKKKSPQKLSRRVIPRLQFVTPLRRFVTQWSQGNDQCSEAVTGVFDHILHGDSF